MIAMMSVMFLNGFVDGLMDNLVRNALKNDLGHFNITTTSYREREKFMPIAEYMPDSAAVAAAVAGATGLESRVVLVEERIRFGVLLSNGAKSKAALAVAGDPEKERSLLMLDKSLREGSYPAAPGDALIGSGIAEDLGLKVGDQLKIVTQKADYGLGFKRFRVSGIFSTNVNSLDGNLFQIGLADARELLGMGEGATQILVMIDDHNLARKDAPRIEAALAAAGLTGLSVQAWPDAGGIVALFPLMEAIYVWVYIIVAFLGAFVIANVMMMVVLERRKEIGMLKAMGMPNRDILALFLMEGALLGALGSAVGVGIGLGLNLLLSVVGVDFSSAMSSFSWPMDNMVYTKVDLLSALGIFLLGVGVASVIAFLPSRTAARMDPIEAIRSV
jgi:ABC-type lipoprotein release transport system permease subunit